MVHLLRGLAAGAAGTTALNALTYLDMALRGRPASTTPEQTVEKAEELLGRSLDDFGEQEAANRRSGVGALLGIASGLATGVVYGAMRARWPRQNLLVMGAVAGAIANVGTTLPMTAAGITDPRQWPVSSWLMDLIPHLGYGVVTAWSYELFTKRG
ncbi:hypothetical protein [Saccharopolyspora rectivirgula]|jgi:hypothetical protein|uniref:Uncharacterized protein n=1 Tax=Saccharopolyspora rectivirgula TaxID=28042 RepID=A0A073B111_9PSEU|nr:hypothetical protein [Saccharopolyspora rectivirgula]KEI44982.1 hypothetical protein GU90_07180 [Saccharopolyspora rectivirgula]